MRRTRYPMSFGPVSQRERRNADLFFAELMGRRAPGAPRLPESAEVYLEDVEAAPFELPPVLEFEDAENVEAVDVEGVDAEAADAEFAEAPPPSPPPTVTKGVDKNEIIVTRADGTRFHVRRKVRTIARIGPDRQTGFCRDDKRMFFRARWCRGTQGTVDVGANVPEAVKRLANDLVNEINKISQGGDPDSLRKTLEKESLEPFLEFNITNPGSLILTGNIKLEVDPSGLTSGKGTVTAKTPWVDIGVEAEIGPDGKKVIVTGTRPLGQRKIKGEDCRHQQLVAWWDVECLRENPVTDTIDPKIPRKLETEQLFLYFEHALIALRREPKGPSLATPNDEADAILLSNPTSGTARLNRHSLERLFYLMRQGYFIAAIEGYASPEGRRPGPQPTDKGALAKWEGNVALACRRAEKVRKLITTHAVRYPTFQMRVPKAEGKSEKPILDAKSGKELEGADLDRALILGVPGAERPREFLERELPHMTPEDRAFITDSSRKLHDRAERLFENLRRVEIRLERAPDRGVKLPDYELQYVRPCPADLIEAAEREWGSRIPFTKPDPPLCN